MTFILKRIDDKKDFYTSKEFKTYKEAYDFLEENIGQNCCSDTDFEKNFYYDIIKKF
tara:strand:+ start:117 stop:287 length:171 start_codon:yes stop_codon:yes gene_type:complete